MAKKRKRAPGGGRKPRYIGKTKILYMRVPESLYPKCVEEVEKICEPLKQGK